MAGLVGFTDHEGRSVFFWPHDAVVYTTIPDTRGTAHVVLNIRGQSFCDDAVPGGVVGIRAREVCDVVLFAARSEPASVAWIPRVDTTALSDLAGTMRSEQTPGA